MTGRCFHEDQVTELLSMTITCDCPRYVAPDQTDAQEALSEALGDDPDDDAGGLA